MEQKYAKNRIRELRKERKLTQEELGGQMDADITGSTVAKLEKGNLALSLEYAQDIGRVLGVSFLEVLGIGDIGVRVIPVLGQVEAGTWREAIAMSSESIAVPANLRGTNLFALRPSGDSMDQIVAEGGFIVVDPDQRDLTDGKVFVVMNGDGEATVKRYRANPMQLEPCSNNPEHQPIRIGNDPFTIVGRAIYVGQDI